MLLLMHTKTAC